MHGAVDHDSIDPFEMGLGNAANVRFVVGVRETLIVDDYFKALKPLWIFVKIDHGLGSLATLVDDRPVDWDSFFLGRQLHGFALEIVVVTASTRY